MSIDTLIFDAIKGLISNRVYPDVAPELATRPYITYQQVGGDAVNFLESTIPSKANARVQVTVWGDTRAQVAALAKQVEDAIRTTIALQATVLGAPVAIYEPDTKLRGTRQDFSVWN